MTNIESKVAKYIERINWCRSLLHDMTRYAIEHDTTVDPDFYDVQNALHKVISNYRRFCKRNNIDCME